MSTHKNNNKTKIQSSVELKEPSYVDMVGKVIFYLIFLAVWFFVGGIITVGPRISHNIGNAVGDFVLGGAFVTWILLPATFLVALFSPVKKTFAVLGINVFFWLAFLLALYVRLKLAYP